MRKPKKILVLIATFLFFVYLFLLFKLYNGLILNLQVYSSLNLITLIFWSGIILICIHFILADIGFMKIGAILTFFTGLLVVIFQILNNTTSYDIVTSDKYKLIVEIIEEPGTIEFKVYNKENILFSEYVDSITIVDNFIVSYDIVGDEFIVTKCNINVCLTDEMELNQNN